MRPGSRRDLVRALAGVATLLPAIWLATGCAGAARPAAPDPAKPCVVMVHGLGRSGSGFAAAAAWFEERGYAVRVIDYPSTDADIATLARTRIAPALAEAAAIHPVVHALAHSLGGILVRTALAEGPPANFGAVVMLGPPNQGSEVVDALSGLPLVDALMGPAFIELGTGPANRWQHLPPPDVPLAVIAGDRSINPINSLLIPGPDDGKVSVARSHAAGERDHLVVPVAHPFLMQDRSVLAAAERFMRTGRLRAESP
jgi:triacylglycerol lipase